MLLAQATREMAAQQAVGSSPQGRASFLKSGRITSVMLLAQAIREVAAQQAVGSSPQGRASFLKEVAARQSCRRILSRQPLA